MATITVNQLGDAGNSGLRPCGFAVQRFNRNDGISSAEKDASAAKLAAAGVKTLIYHWSGGPPSQAFSTRDPFPGPTSADRDWSSLSGNRSLDVMFNDDLARLRAAGSGDEKIMLVLFDHPVAILNGGTSRTASGSQVPLPPAAQFGASPLGIMGARACVDAIIARYDPSGPDRIRGFMSGQEKKGWADISNATLDNVAAIANNIFSHLAANHPGYERWAPHFNLWASASLSARRAAMDALLAGGSSFEANDELILNRLIDQLDFSLLTGFTVDNSIVDNNADSWRGDYAEVISRVSLEYHVARALNAKMIARKGVAVPIKGAESYFDVNQTGQDWANILVSGTAPAPNSAARRDPTWSSALKTAMAIWVAKAGLYGFEDLALWEPQEGSQSGGEAQDGNVASWVDKDGNAYTALLQIGQLTSAVPPGTQLFPVTVDNADIVAVAGGDKCFALNTNQTAAVSTGVSATGGTVAAVSIPPLDVHTFDLPALSVGDPPVSLYNSMKGTFVAPTSDAGTNVITLLDDNTGEAFNGKLARFWTTGQTSTGTAAGASKSYGASDGTNHGWCGDAYDDNVATKNAGKYQRTDSCIGVIADGNPTVSSRATCAFTAGTMTITWPDAPPTGSVIHYIVYGGSAFEAAVGNVTLPATLADVTVSGLAFDPTHIETFGVRQVASTPDGGTVHGQFHIGMTDGTTKFVELAGEPDGVGTSTGVRDHRTDRIVLALNDTTTIGFDVEATGVTFGGAGSFTILNNNPPNVADCLEFYIAIRAPAAAIGVETKPVTNTTKKTTLAFQPGSVFMVSACDFGVQSTTSGEGCQAFAIGAMTAAAQGSIWAGSDDAQATSATDKRHSTTAALEIYDPGTPTNVGTATRSSLDVDGFTLDWTGTSANPTDFGYFALPKGTPNAVPDTDLALLGVG